MTAADRDRENESDTWARGPHPERWWEAMERHRENESRARHSADDALAKRVDDLEQWRDTLRGGLYTVKLLIGSNVLLACVSVVALLVSAAQ